MNERIRALAHEAGLPTYNPEGVPTKLEKFAKLIVKECAENIRGHMITTVTGAVVNNDFNVGLAHASESIKEHFGVEE